MREPTLKFEKKRKRVSRWSMVGFDLKINANYFSVSLMSEIFFFCLLVNWPTSIVPREALIQQHIQLQIDKMQIKQKYLILHLFLNSYFTFLLSASFPFHQFQIPLRDFIPQAAAATRKIKKDEKN